MRDLDLLLEVGLGVDRRLNEQRRKQGESLLQRADVTWWYLANHLGQRFRAEVQEVLGASLQQLGEGLWSCPALGRGLYLVSRDALPVERESVPLHLVTAEPLERVKALAREMVRQPGFWERYGSFLALLNPDNWEELQIMIRQMGTEPNLDLRWLVNQVGLKQVIDQVGLKQVIDQIGLKEVIDQVGLKQVIDQVGLKQVIDQVGPKQVIDQVGPKQVIDLIGLKEVLQTAEPGEIVALLGQDWFLSHLTPEQIQELKRRLP